MRLLEGDEDKTKIIQYWTNIRGISKGTAGTKWLKLCGSNTEPPEVHDSWSVLFETKIRHIRAYKNIQKIKDIILRRTAYGWSFDQREIRMSVNYIVN